MLCWPFLIVSGTALTALLFPLGEGKGMGIFYAVLAMACITGSTIGGWLAAQWDFTAAAGMAVITESLGLIFISGKASGVPDAFWGLNKDYR